MSDTIGMVEKTSMAEVLAAAPGVQLGILFGSLVQGAPRPDSDVDLAVMARAPLSAEAKMALIEQLAQQTNRPVDLVDLQTAHGVLLRRILQTGERIYDPDPDHRLYVELLKRHVFYQTDFAPYRRRLLKERRRAWIEN